MKKNLALLIYSMGAGGAERVVSILLPYLIKEYNVTLVLMNETIFYDIPKEVDIVWIERSNPYESGIKKLLKLPILGWRFNRLCKEKDIDIVVSFMNRPNYIALFSKFISKEIPLVISERATPLQEYGTNSLKDIINRLLIRKLYPFANLIIVNSVLIKEQLSLNLGIKDNKIEVIYNPIDIENIKKMSKAQELPFKKDNKFIFVNIARFYPQKNHYLLIKAFSTLEMDNIELWLIGGGKLEDDLKNYAKSLSVDKKIKFMGRQKNPYIFLKNADCYVLSSLYEGFPNTLLEALACNLATISTDCYSGPREILDNNIDYSKPIKGIFKAKFGVLVENNNPIALADAMRMIYNDSIIRNRYSKIAITRAREFEKSKIISRYLDSIKDTFTSNKERKLSNER